MDADHRLREQIAERLRSFEVRAIDLPAARRAAVAVPVVEEGHGAALPGLPAPKAWSRRAALMLTRRADHLQRHAGQWALPGGRCDAGEVAEAAALRELHEEVGVHLDEGAILGRLDDYATRSGYVITPVVVWAGAARALRLDPQEVRSVHRIPMEEFLRVDAPLLEWLPASEHPVLRMPLGPAWIAAPTAAVIYQFRELCLLGRATRVAHFDQPEFAWK